MFRTWKIQHLEHTLNGKIPSPEMKSLVCAEELFPATPRLNGGRTPEVQAANEVIKAYNLKNMNRQLQDGAIVNNLSPAAGAKLDKVQKGAASKSIGGGKMQSKLNEALGIKGIAVATTAIANPQIDYVAPLSCDDAVLTPLEFTRKITEMQKEIAKTGENVLQSECHEFVELMTKRYEASLIRLASVHGVPVPKSLAMYKKMAIYRELFFKRIYIPNSDTEINGEATPNKRALGTEGLLSIGSLHPCATFQECKAEDIGNLRRYFMIIRDHPEDIRVGQSKGRLGSEIISTPPGFGWTEIPDVRSDAAGRGTLPDGSIAPPNNPGAKAFTLPLSFFS
jgi:hypothetical protein